MGYILKGDSKILTLQTGARRASQDNKPRYDLIPEEPLYRVAMLYMRGAKKYGERNWEKGISADRNWASLLRHVHAKRRGDEKEDHLAAIVWNSFAIMEGEERAKRLHRKARRAVSRARAGDKKRRLPLSGVTVSRGVRRSGRRCKGNHS